MQLGYSTWGMPDTPIDTILAHLAGLGFDGVEIAVLPRYTTALSKLDNGERRRIAGLLQQHKLTLSAISSYVSTIEPDAVAYAENHAAIQGAVDLAVDWAQDGEPPVVITGIAGQRGQLAAHQAQLVERLNALGDYAQERGVIIALEPHIDAAVETPDQAVALMTLIQSPAIRINFDISHFNILGIPIEDSVKKLLPYSVHTHVKDERGQYPNFEFVIPGEGEFDYVRYLKAMHAHGYSGFVSTEISMMVQRRPNYDALATATQSYQVLSAAFAAAGLERRRP